MMTYGVFALLITLLLVGIGVIVGSRGKDGERSCPACGRLNSSWADYCANCGAKLNR
ncbi:MAG TPA: hypothetical protein P5081_07005 [Phycisphaerae bacterium]|nr:hypothetical protein [Phycisphaerae bacterium]HRW52621.1 hypothetical protein [Phycisphaerae bacterium]